MWQKKFWRPGLVASLFTLITSCGTKVDHDLVTSTYKTPLTPPAQKLDVYHLGHSLVNRDMPHMLRQLAGEGHEFSSQIGWGSTLQSHWEPDIEVAGYAQENTHAEHVEVHEAITNKNIDAFIMTEMVEINDSIRYFDSAKYVSLFAEKVAKHNPDARIYLYETWHNIDDPQGWLNRLQADLPKFWEAKILDVALTKLDGSPPIHLIPAGQALLSYFEQAGALDNPLILSDIEELFAKNEDGSQDTIHLNDLGNYFVALVHYTVLYHKNPVGLPHQLTRADGTAYLSPTKETAQLMQKVAWEVATNHPRTGVKNIH